MYCLYPYDKETNLHYSWPNNNNLQYLLYVFIIYFSLSKKVDVDFFFLKLIIQFPDQVSLFFFEIYTGENEMFVQNRDVLYSMG